MNTLKYKRIDPSIFDVPVVKFVPLPRLSQVGKVVTESYELVSDGITIPLTVDCLQSVDDYSVTMPFGGLSQEHRLYEDFGDYSYPEYTDEKSYYDDQYEQDSIDNYEYGIYMSELHPFKTEFCLVGGGKNKNAKMKYKKKKKGPKRQQGGLPRSVQPKVIMPPQWHTSLKHNSDEFQLATGGSTFLLQSFRINALYDVGPGILTTSFAGFFELMAFYEFYRVKKITVNWDVANNEAFPLQVGIAFNNRDLDTIVTTRQGAIDVLENGIAMRPRQLQRNTGGKSDTRFSVTISIASILGSRSLYYGNDNYIGTPTTDPTDLIFMSLVVIGPTTATTLGNGVIGTLLIESHALLFGRRVILDPSSAAENKKRAEELQKSSRLLPQKYLVRQKEYTEKKECSANIEEIKPEDFDFDEYALALHKKYPTQAEKEIEIQKCQDNLAAMIKQFSLLKKQAN
jgi:hypothetical protein